MAPPSQQYLIVAKRAQGTVDTAVAHKVDAVYVGAAVHGCMSDDDGECVGGCSVWAGMVCKGHAQNVVSHKKTNVLLAGVICRRQYAVVVRSIGRDEPISEA